MTCQAEDSQQDEGDGAQTAGRMAVDNAVSVVALWPDREFEIRRRCAKDGEFLTIVADHGEAVAAFARWRQAAGPDDPRTREYAGIVDELEREILARLDSRHPATAAHRDGARDT